MATNIRSLGYLGPVQAVTPVGVPPEVFSGNKTTTPLAGSATFTGDWERFDSPDVGVSCKTDADGTLYFDFSNDGTNVDTFPVNGFTVHAGVHEFHTAVKLPRFFRVRLVNGSSAQTYLRLYTYYGQFRQANSPINASISSDSDAAVVRTISSEIDLALGRFGGMESGTKFGRNSDVDTTSTPEDLWEGGGIYTGHPLSFTPETVDVFSDDANDTAAGTGARTVRISGLKSDASTSYETEDLTLNGTSAVTSSDTWWRVNRVVILTAGSGGANAGTITVRSTTTTANVFAGVPAGANQSQIGAFTVPAGQTMILKRIRVALTRTTGAAGSATVSLRARPPGGVYRGIRIFELQTGSPTEFTAFAGDTLDAGTDLKFHIENVSDNNSVFDGAIEYVFVET